MLFSRIDSTATIDWCPVEKKPLLALGTAAGTLDASFNTSGELGIYALSEDEFATSREATFSKLGSVSSRFRFNKISWGPGLLACALENGLFNIWNIKTILGTSSEKKPIVSVDSGVGSDIPMTSLEFSALDPKNLATGNSEGQVGIWDMSSHNISSPLTILNSKERLAAVAWNKKTSNVLASASIAGSIIIWDTYQKSKIIELKDLNNNSTISDICWDPFVATHFITSSDNDSTPYLYLWDLRNPRSPVSVLSGHTKGILSASWCTYDSNLIASCGKDNRVLISNISTGNVEGELATYRNSAFEVKWSPINPNLVAACNFDGNVSVYNIMVPETTSVQSAGMSADGFMRNQNSMRTKPLSAQSTFRLNYTPSWLKVTSGAAFGCGNQLFSFTQGSPLALKRNVIVDEESYRRIQLVEQVFQNRDLNAIKKICADRIEMFSKCKNPYLKQSELSQWMLFDYAISNDINNNVVKCLYEMKNIYNNNHPGQYSIGELFNGLTTSNAINIRERTHESGNEGNSPLSLCKIHPSFYAGMDSSTKVSSSIYLGDIETASEASIEIGKLDEALIIASLGGPATFDKIRSMCIEKKGPGLPHMNLVNSIINGDFSSIIDNENLDMKDEATRSNLISLIHRYSTDDSTKTLLYSTLGDRFDEIDNEHDGEIQVDYKTVLCYMLSKSFNILYLWHKMFLVYNSYLGLDNKNTSRPLRFDALQNLVEKIVIYNILVGPIESFAAPGDDQDKLYAAYTEYSDYISNMRFFKFAFSLLENIPISYKYGCYQLIGPNSTSEHPKQLEICDGNDLVAEIKGKIMACLDESDENISTSRGQQNKPSGGNLSVQPPTSHQQPSQAYQPLQTYQPHSQQYRSVSTENASQQYPPIHIAQPPQQYRPTAPVQSRYPSYDPIQPLQKSPPTHNLHNPDKYQPLQNLRPSQDLFQPQQQSMHRFPEVGQYQHYKPPYVPQPNVALHTYGSNPQLIPRNNLGAGDRENSADALSSRTGSFVVPPNPILGGQSGRNFSQSLNFNKGNENEIYQRPGVCPRERAGFNDPPIDAFSNQDSRQLKQPWLENSNVHAGSMYQPNLQNSVPRFGATSSPQNPPNPNPVRSFACDTIPSQQRIPQRNVQNLQVNTQNKVYQQQNHGMQPWNRQQQQNNGGPPEGQSFSNISNPPRSGYGDPPIYGNNQSRF